MAQFKFYESSQKWQAIIRKKGFPPKYKTFKTKIEAEKWATIVESEMIRDIFVDTKEATVTTLADALNRYKSLAMKNKGYEMELNRIERWQSSSLANRPLSSLRAKDFDEYRDTRREDGIADATIKNDLSVIAATFKHFDFGVGNPVAKTMKTLAPSKKRSRRLSKEEEKYLIAELDDTKCSDPKRANKWIPLVTRFAIETAARRSEILGKDKSKHEAAIPGLIWENVNIQKCICKFTNTKNGTDRFSPLSPAAIACLETAKMLSQESVGQVFKTTNSAVKQAWMRAKDRAITQYKSDGGQNPDFLLDFTFHDNRHEAASRWSRGFDIKTLQLVTGHKDIRSLMRYVNPDEEDVAAISVKMAEQQNKKITE